MFLDAPIPNHGYPDNPRTGEIPDYPVRVQTSQVMSDHFDCCTGGDGMGSDTGRPT